jgi:hypothetical protein
MTALAAARNTPQMLTGLMPAYLYTGVTVYQGGIVSIDTSHGYAVPGATSTSHVVWGIAQETVTNSGASGTKSVNVKIGTFKFLNSAAADAITVAETGGLCYLVDDQTVAKTNGTSTRSVAGRIVQVDSDGVWVDIDPDKNLSTAYATLTGGETLTNKRVVTRQGANITGNVTVNVADGTQFAVIPGAGTTVTLGTTNAAAGDRMVFTKFGTEAYATAIGSLFTIPSGCTGRVEIEYVGSAWRLVAGVIRSAARPIAVQAAAISFAAGDVTVAVADGEEFDIPTTGTNSTVTIATTGAVAGSRMLFRADGTKNGHTVTYRVGVTAITAAATASKRHLCIASFDGTTWVANLSVGP